MSNNPSCTLVRRIHVTTCYAAHPKKPWLLCDRADNHRGHCCNRSAREAWNARGVPASCLFDFDHRAEKDLATR